MSAGRTMLAPYTGNWDRREATHLLWRTQGGATEAEITQSVREGLAGTLDRLLTPQSESDTFLKTDALLRRTAFDTREIRDLKAWWARRLLYSANPLVETLTLFWHNHFATSFAKVQSVEHMAAQNDLLRRESLGSFRRMLSGMTRDVAMLIWLDGNANRKRHANENFAREVMELFSLGVGHYTEKDIQEAARAFSGWHVREGKFWFNTIQHDDGTKTVLGRSGNLNGDDIIELCLDQPACPRFLATKLLRSFVTPQPGDAILEDLAQSIRRHNYELTPVLRELLGSQLFFDPANRHALIKSPVQLVLGAQRTLEARPHLQNTVELLAQLGQDLFEPPTVKGWEGGRLWISSTTLLQRSNFAAELATGGRYGGIADPTKLATSKSWSDADAVAYYTELLLSRDLDADSRQSLQDYLTQAGGDDSQRLRGLLHLIMSMPEFQLL